MGALLESAGRQGKVGFDAAARSAAALNARIREIQVAIDPLADEFARLGIQSQASLNATRDAAKSAFEAIRDGAARGKASVEDVRRAFRAYAEANGSLDLQARVVSLFDQAAWNNVWADSPSGSVAPGTYNETDYPLAVKNADAITERWAVRFTSSTQFEVIGETVGTIATGNTTTDLAPLNPRTGAPYFVMKREGWGTGWSTNNVVRFNTVGGLAPVWLMRTTLPGTPDGARDSTRFQVVGNVAGE